MKILTRNKIVEAFHFPFSEALVFSILLWTAWGLAEAFYWERLSRILHGVDQHIHSSIYLQSFFIYVGVAAFLAILVYVGMRIVLATFHLHQTRTFRSFTLCGILATFFSAAMIHCWRSSIWQSLPPTGRYSLIIMLTIFDLVLLIVLYRWASSEDFRIRRSGTMMLSIVVISAVLSFISFPIFSNQSSDKKETRMQQGYRHLMAYRYIAPLINR